MYVSNFNGHVKPPQEVQEIYFIYVIYTGRTDLKILTTVYFFLFFSLRRRQVRYSEAMRYVE